MVRTASITPLVARGEAWTWLRAILCWVTAGQPALARTVA